MRISRSCKICGNHFSAIKVTQFFCSRKCFKKDYYIRTKGKLQDEEEHPTHPLKNCNLCHEQSRLSFDPVSHPKEFDAWGCPKCGATNELIWQYQDSPNSYQEIRSVLVSMSIQSSSVLTEVKYETYKLPASRPEQGSPHIVVLSCETVIISDLQKKNRKKILFP